MRPKVEIEAEMEAGRVNLPKKVPKNLKEAAATSKMLERHSVGTDSNPNLTFWKLLCILPESNEQTSYFQNVLVTYIKLLHHQLSATILTIVPV